MNITVKKDSFRLILTPTYRLNKKDFLVFSLLDVSKAEYTLWWFMTGKRPTNDCHKNI